MFGEMILAAGQTLAAQPVFSLWNGIKIGAVAKRGFSYKRQLYY